jgi:hypothetical protein
MELSINSYIKILNPGGDNCISELMYVKNWCINIIDKHSIPSNWPLQCIFNKAKKRTVKYTVRTST